jgi:hypothetical protein
MIMEPAAAGDGASCAELMARRPEGPNSHLGRRPRVIQAPLTWLHVVYFVWRITYEIY